MRFLLAFAICVSFVGVSSALSFKELLHKVSSAITNKQCEKKIAKKEIPSADKGDSPLSAFGYPKFNLKAKSVILQTRAPLSYIGGFKQPIKVEAEDYVIAGDKKELKAFFQCFADYEVQGKGLNEEGRWVEDASVSTIKIQVINAMDDKIAKLTKLGFFGAIFSLSMDKIVDIFDPKTSILQNVAFITGLPKKIGELKDTAEILQKIKDYLPDPKKTTLKIQELSKDKSLSAKQKFKAFLKWRKDEEAKKKALAKKWQEASNVEKSGKVIVTLTMYAKPSHKVRATYNTGVTKIKMADVGKAVLSIL